MRLNLNSACIAFVDALINTQKGTKQSNGGPDASLEGKLHGGFNVALERCT